MQERTICEPALKIIDNKSHKMLDKIAIESKLSITIIHGPLFNRTSSRFATVLRTPGDDELLIYGLFYSLGIIKNVEDICAISPCFRSRKNSLDNLSTTVELSPHIAFDPVNHGHAHARYSSCGFCGNNQDVLMPSIECSIKKNLLNIKQIYKNLSELNAFQTLFNQTGGTHGAALFSFDGTFINLYEDIGRHNALDKLVGFMLLEKKVPIENHILFITSRASYEIVQKAAMAGISIVAVMGAVSSLSIEMAKTAGITLIGFLRDHRLNIYTHSHRLHIED